MRMSESFPPCQDQHKESSDEEMDEDMDIWREAYELSRKEIAHHDGIPYSIEASRQMEYDT